MADIKLLTDQLRQIAYNVQAKQGLVSFLISAFFAFLVK